MYVMNWPNMWKYYMHLIEFAYNNGYQASLRISPFEVIYGSKCRFHISWSNLEDILVLGPNLLKDMQHIVQNAKKNLKLAQDRQKSYVDMKIFHKEFKVGDHVYVIVNAGKSTLSLGGCAKLVYGFCRSFETLARTGPVAYQLALPVSI